MRLSGELTHQQTAGHPACVGEGLIYGGPTKTTNLWRRQILRCGEGLIGVGERSSISSAGSLV